MSLYVCLKPENLNADLPCLKGRYELVKDYILEKFPRDFSQDAEDAADP